MKRGNDSYGGAIFNQGELTVENCVFTENTGDYGAVITNYGNFMNYPMAVIINSRFENNTITTGTSGGALYNEMFAEMIVEGCTFTNNSVNNIGGAIYTCYESNLTVRNSKFKWNHAENAGGAIHTEYGASTIIDSVFH